MKNQLSQKKTKGIETLQRQLIIAKRQWDNWKAEAMRLNDRLQRYEPGSRMLLNSKVTPAGVTVFSFARCPARTIANAGREGLF